MLVYVVSCHCVFFFKQKTAYEMRISDWSSDVCSSDLLVPPGCGRCSTPRRHVGRAERLGLALAGATLLRHGRLHGEPVDEVVHRVAGVALDPAERDLKSVV